MSDRKGSAPRPTLDAGELAARVRAKRMSEGLSLRRAADYLGMSAATISRVETGHHLPERDHLLRLADWAGLPLGSAGRGHRLAEVHADDASTVEAVELHLRADKDLNPGDAEFLVQMMRSAYEQMSKRGK